MWECTIDLLNFLTAHTTQLTGTTVLDVRIFGIFITRNNVFVTFVIILNMFSIYCSSDVGWVWRERTSPFVVQERCTFKIM